MLDTERQHRDAGRRDDRDSILSRYNKFGMDFYLIDTAGLRKRRR